jgi:hypothetical protein
MRQRINAWRIKMIMNHRNNIPFFLNEEGLTGIGAEIGVYRGEFSKHILDNWNCNKFYLIDSWKHFDNIIDISNHTKEEHEKNYEVTIESMKKFGDRVTIIRKLSTDASLLLQDELFDFVYIDAGHMYAQVMADLISWYPKVKVGGYMMGHDYIDGMMLNSIEEKLPTVFEVKSAVNAFSLKFNLTVSIIPDPFYPSWCIKKVDRPSCDICIM